MYDFIYYQVRDVMTSHPVTVDHEDHLGHVHQMFQESDFNGMPVVENGDRLVGMVTKLDVLKAFIFTGKAKVLPFDIIMAKPVSRVMTAEPIVFEPETPLTRVLPTMVQTRHKSFPVVEGERVVGIIAREDLLTALHRAAKQLPPQRVMDQKATF